MAHTLSNVITILDADIKLPAVCGEVFRWNGYGEDDGQHALLDYCETHSQRLRAKYCQWVHDLGESRIQDKRVIDHLAIDDQMSFWWMTLLAEKSHYKSPISKAIRLLAVEEILSQKSPAKVQLVSGDRVLHETLSTMCQALGIDYEWQKQPAHSEATPWFRRLLSRLPHPIQALIFLAGYVWRSLSHGAVDKPVWSDDKEALFVCTYFLNFDLDRADKGEFHSGYWEGLHGLIKQHAIPTSWLHLYLPNHAAPSPRATNIILQRFNRKKQPPEAHGFVEACFSLPMALSILKAWLRLLRTSWRLRHIEAEFTPAGSHLSLWPLMRQDWHSSIRGSAAISGLRWLALFDRTMADAPTQNKGLYLSENQAWERALIWAWKRHSHGQLIGVIHTMVRFWDIRYSFDDRTMVNTRSHGIPWPDLTAANGKVAMDAFAKRNHPKGHVVECEALRYGYINQRRTKKKQSPRRDDAINILILGEYEEKKTVKLMRLVEAAAAHFSPRARYSIKLHPASQLSKSDCSIPGLQVVDGAIGEILEAFDIVIASDSTSAVIDTLLAGVPTIIMLDEKELNYSPMRGQDSVQFVANPQELVTALNKATTEPFICPQQEDFFFLDPDFPRWQGLLAQGAPGDAHREQNQ